MPPTGDCASVFSRLLNEAQRLGGRLQSQADDAAELRFGSIFNYRMLGLMSKPNRRPLVLKVNVEPVSTTLSEIEAEALSNPGWSPFPGLTRSLMEEQYADAFQVLFDDLRRGVADAKA
jgi:hypothetical protein